MVKQDKISQAIGLIDALSGKMIAKILLYPVLSVLIWRLFNSRSFLIGVSTKGGGHVFNCESTSAANFRYLAIT